MISKCVVSVEGDSVIAMTPAVSETAQNLSIALQVFNESIDTGFTFDYRPNPTVTDMQPRSHLLGYAAVITFEFATMLRKNNIYYFWQPKAGLSPHAHENA